jgi:hypothetical protein
MHRCATEPLPPYSRGSTPNRVPPHRAIDGDDCLSLAIEDLELIWTGEGVAACLDLQGGSDLGEQKVLADLGKAHERHRKLAGCGFHPLANRGALRGRETLMIRPSLVKDARFTNGGMPLSDAGMMSTIHEPAKVRVASESD